MNSAATPKITKYIRFRRVAFWLSLIDSLSATSPKANGTSAKIRVITDSAPTETFVAHEISSPRVVADVPMNVRPAIAPNQAIGFARLHRLFSCQATRMMPTTNAVIIGVRISARFCPSHW